MQVVILAAGRGQRFVQAGYTVPKPLIEVLGKRLITRAMEQAAVVTSKPIVLCPAHITQDVWRSAPLIVMPQVLGIEYVQSGAALTLLAATSALNEDVPIMVMDCDSVVDYTELRKYTEWSEQLFAHGDYCSTVLCFKVQDESSKYSFVEVCGDNFTVHEVAEKRRISNTATTGVHCFKSWTILRKAVCTMVTDDDTTNDEFYLAPAHNYLSAAAYTLPDGKFTALGTPEQVEAYEQEQSR